MSVYENFIVYCEQLLSCPGCSGHYNVPHHNEDTVCQIFKLQFVTLYWFSFVGCLMSFVWIFIACYGILFCLLHLSFIHHQYAPTVSCLCILYKGFQCLEYSSVHLVYSQSTDVGLTVVWVASDRQPHRRQFKKIKGLFGNFCQHGGLPFGENSQQNTIFKKK